MEDGGDLMEHENSTELDAISSWITPGLFKIMYVTRTENLENVLLRFLKYDNSTKRQMSQFRESTSNGLCII